MCLCIWLGRAELCQGFTVVGVTSVHDVGHKLIYGCAYCLLSFVSATRQLRLYAEEYLTHRDITFACYLCEFHHSLLVDRFSARYVRTSISVKYIFTQRKHPICIYCQQGNLIEMSLLFFRCIPRISRLFC